MVTLKNVQLMNNNSCNKNKNHKLSKIINHFIYILLITSHAGLRLASICYEEMYSVQR
jgi:hypothetical protein